MKTPDEPRELNPVVMFNDQGSDTAAKPKTPADYYQEFFARDEPPVDAELRRGAGKE